MDTEKTNNDLSLRLTFKEKKLGGLLFKGLGVQKDIQMPCWWRLSLQLYSVFKLLYVNACTYT